LKKHEEALKSPDLARPAPPGVALNDNAPIEKPSKILRCGFSIGASSFSAAAFGGPRGQDYWQRFTRPV